MISMMSHIVLISAVDKGIDVATRRRKSVLFIIISFMIYFSYRA